jgi:putative Mg2+ transporter-C (MgtC) family protein
MTADLSLQALMIVRLVVAAVLGAAIGYERERHGHQAGMRTYALLSLGAALFTVLSIDGFTGHGASVDPSRLAAQVVSGVGFLCAGAIFREGFTIRGLTTAAALWAAAAVGMAAAAGAELIAFAATAIALFFLWPANRIGSMVGPRSHRAFRFSIDCDDEQGLERAIEVISVENGSTSELKSSYESDQLNATMIVTLPRESDPALLVGRIGKQKRVRTVRFSPIGDGKVA